MAIDIFERRAMGQMLREAKPPRTFIRDLFFNAKRTYNTKWVDVDVQTGTRRVARFVSENAAASVSDRTGFDVHTHQFPLIKEARPTQAADLLIRQPGNHIYESIDPVQQAAQMLASDLAELDEMIARREERMCVQALFSGALTIAGDGFSYTIDFSMPAGQRLDAGAGHTMWDAGGFDLADLIAQLILWRRVVTRSGGLAPTDLILGNDATDQLLALCGAGTAGALDVRRYDSGLIAPEITQTPGVTYLGRLAGTGMDIWSYDEWQIDPATGAEGALIPEKQILLGSRQAYCEMRYGAIGLADQGNPGAPLQLFEGERVPDAWVSKNPDVHWVGLHSRPCPVPVGIKSFMRVAVLA